MTRRGVLYFLLRAQAGRCTRKEKIGINVTSDVCLEKAGPWAPKMLCYRGHGYPNAVSYPTGNVAGRLCDLLQPLDQSSQKRAGGSLNRYSCTLFPTSHPLWPSPPTRGRKRRSNSYHIANLVWIGSRRSRKQGLPFSPLICLRYERICSTACPTPLKRVSTLPTVAVSEVSEFLREPWQSKVPEFFREEPW